MRLTPRTDAAATLALAMPQLPPNVQDALRHRYGLAGRKQLSQRETAVLLKISEAEVYATTCDGLGQLRRLIIGGKWL